MGNICFVAKLTEHTLFCYILLASKSFQRIISYKMKNYFTFNAQLHKFLLWKTIFLRT